MKAMKKNYQQPAMCTVRIQHQSMVCSTIQHVSSNAGMNYGGGSSLTGRVRSDNGFDWDDDWSE